MHKKLLSYKIALYLVAIFGIGSVALAYYGYPPGQPMNEPSPPLASSEAPIIPLEESLGAAVLTGTAFDVVGTKTGTSVAYGYFDRLGNGTTTYPIALDPLADGGVFTVRAVGTTTHEIAYLSVMMSQDSQCDTATTSSPILNAVVKNDINWFDAGAYLLNKISAATDTNTGTTTFVIDHSVQSPVLKVIPFVGLNARCLSAEINASSTNLWVQFKQNSKP